MYSRICIFGRPGSGKSTAAQIIAQRTGLPLYHLDKYFYVDNWVERDYQEFLTMQYDIVNQERWIIDGNSLMSLEMRYARAEICLYFNYSRWVCLWRLMKRYFFKNTNIDDRAQNCPEVLRWRFIRYMWCYESRRNYRLISLIADLKTRYPNVEFIEIRNDKELESFLDSLPKAT